MIDCSGIETSDGATASVASGEEDLRRIARYLALAIAGDVVTIENAASALVEWSDADTRALEDAAARSEPGSVAECLLKVAASAHSRAA